jgi:Caspase domain.
MRKIGYAALLAAVCFALIGASAPAEPARRALIITSDYFLSLEDMRPCAANNGKAAEAVFNDEWSLKTQTLVMQDEINSHEALEAAISQTFHAAREDDISYLYISTHGVLAEEPYLVLSDGIGEYHLTADALAALLKPVKGTKVLIIDACHSGAFINKGSSTLAVSHPFTGPDYKVLTSAGADEQSWFWHTDDSGGEALWGAGYFSEVLSLGLSSRGSFSADLNSDGDITLSECHRYLLDNHGASTPRIYPQNDDFVLVRYNFDAFSKADPLPYGMINGIGLSESLLNLQDPLISFELTALRPTKLAYRFIYQKDGRWDFEDAPLLYDTFELGGDYGDEQGAVSPGRKTRSLLLNPQGEDSYGYALMQLFSLSEISPAIHFSRALAVPKMGGDPHMSLTTPDSFAPAFYEEIPIHLSHLSPLCLSLSIENEAGETIFRLASRRATRPEQLKNPGSAFYWDGRKKDGTLAPEGQYRLKAIAHYPEQSYTAYSDYFTLPAP